MPGNLLSDLVGIPSVQTVLDLQSENSSLKTQMETMQSSLTQAVSASVSQIISSEGDLPALTWSAVTAPTGITKKYWWSQTGRKVVLDVAIRATGPGVTVSGVTFPFPSECPPPMVMSLVGPNTLAYPGHGGIADGLNLNPGESNAAIFRLPDVNGVRKFQIRITATLPRLAAVMAHAQFEYLTA